MELACLGLNYKTAPVEIREVFSVVGTRLGQEAQRIRDLINSSIPSETVVISTCNRTEFYLASHDPQQAIHILLQQLLHEHDLRKFPDIEKHFYHLSRQDVATHLCRVVSGLDSMLLGETEIFGQVKQAYDAALKNQTTGSALNRLFQGAFRVGKKVRTETKIQEGATSVAGAAVEVAEKIFGKLKGSRVIVIGAGDTSRQTAQALQSRGAESVFVTNRSRENAEKLASDIGGRVVDFDGWQSVLAGVDVVISSTSAPHAVVMPFHIEAVRSVRRYRPLFLIDIAVPRDIHADCGKIEEVYLYDIDKLEGFAAEARQRRLHQIQECELLIQNELPKLNLIGT